MTTHTTGTREEWLAARLELLEAEKELTRRSDEVAQRRQELPWVRLDKEYRFDTDEGSASLADLFRGRSQLLVYHFMFGPDYTAGCPSCSTIADGFNGFAVHLANHDVMLWAVSRAPLAKLQAYKQRMGWTLPVGLVGAAATSTPTSTSGSPRQQQRDGGIDYNYRREAASNGARASRPARGGVALFAAMCRHRSRPPITRERPGMSAFVLEDGVVYHTYSTYARGVDGIWGMYQWLDRAPQGPQRARACGGSATTSTRGEARARSTARRVGKIACCVVSAWARRTRDFAHAESPRHAPLPTLRV